LGGLGAPAGAWPVPRIFSLIQERADIPDEEMVRTFNLGIGLTCVVHDEQVATALAAVPEAHLLGRVVRVEPDGPRVRFS
jgi:phosphoribosylaminoimidazole (AIR) synthetase